MTNYNSFLKVEKRISLPVLVETHAILITWNEELFVLINSVANKETLVFKLNNAFTLEKITALSILSTTAVICDNQMIVSGADSEGKPVIVAINSAGKILWKKSLNVTPSIWPIVVCGEETYIAWQEKPDEIKLEKLNLDTKKIVHLHSITIENPPATLHPLPKTIVAVISEKNQTAVVDLITNQKSSLKIPQPLVIGQTDKNIFFGYLEKNTICLKYQNEEKPHYVSVKNALSGKLKAISGSEAALWILKQEMTIDGDYQWKSSIIQENTEVFDMEGLVYAVATWNKVLAIIQDSKIVILKKQATK